MPTTTKVATKNKGRIIHVGNSGISSVSEFMVKNIVLELSMVNAVACSYVPFSVAWIVMLCFPSGIFVRFTSCGNDV